MPEIVVLEVPIIFIFWVKHIYGNNFWIKNWILDDLVSSFDLFIFFEVLIIYDIYLKGIMPMQMDTNDYNNW